MTTVMTKAESDRLDAREVAINTIKGYDLPLQDGDIDFTEIHRPNLSVFANSDWQGCYVNLSIHAMQGQQKRFVELTPDQARKLAHMLLDMACTVERIALDFEE